MARRRFLNRALVVFSFETMYNVLSGIIKALVNVLASAYFVGDIFFSSQNVFRTFSQNEVLIVVSGFLELYFRCCTVVSLAKTPVVVFVRVYLYFALVLQLCTRVTHFCTPVTRKPHSSSSQSKLSFFFFHVYY